jgi:hypothetical protein
VTARYEASFAHAFEQAMRRLDRSHRSFLDRATAALISHLETYGELTPWSYDPTGLRLLMRSGYQVFARGVRSAGEAAAQEAATGVAELYAGALGQPAEAFRIQPPCVPRLAPPVLLGQTIALDLQSTWWRRWWSRRRGYAAFAPEFYGMIEAETRPILEALREGHCRPAGEEIRATLAGFFADQRATLARLSAATDGAAPEPADHVSRAGAPLDRAPLEDAVSRLGRLAA